MPDSGNWMDSLSGWQKLILQGGAFAVVCASLIVVYYDLRSTHTEELKILDERRTEDVKNLNKDIERNTERLKEVREDARKAADIHGKSAEALRQDAIKQRQDFIEALNKVADQRLAEPKK